MSISICRRTASISIIIVGIATCALPARAGTQVLATYYRADAAFPQYRAFWHEDSNLLDEVESPETAKAAGDAKLGATLHVFVRNTGPQVEAIKDVVFEGISLNEAIANSGQRKRKEFASIYFSKLAKPQVQKLVDAGEPVWWKADPVQVPAGGTGEVTIRIRQAPKAGAVALKLVTSAGSIDVPAVKVAASAPRFAGISFAPGLREVFLYFRHPAGKGTAPTRVLMDGDDITRRCTIRRDAAIDLVPVTARLDKALADASYHIFTGVFADGSQAVAGIRAWRDEFAYGIFGGKSGKDDDPEIGRQYIDDVTSHHINVQMCQIGSGVQPFLRDPAGRKYFLDRGMRPVQNEVGKWGLDNPFALYVHDEPDCGDFKVKEIPDNKKIGCMARWVIARGHEMREKVPAAPQMLNLDMTYKPTNWYTYGQIPDIFTIDPYYQARQKTAFTTHPERIPLYAKATYVHAVGVVAKSASEPRPMHVILNSVRHLNKNDKTKVDFRFATPQEKRIEVYYALAAGAKGLSYWWYSPGAPAYGVGAATSGKYDPEAVALWREIGLLGAEVRTAGPAILNSCPIALPVQAPKELWVRFLVAGDNTLVMLAVNDNYSNDAKGTRYKPVADAKVAVTLPAWLDNPQAFEIAATGIKPITAKPTAGGFELPLGKLDIARMIVITTDSQLRKQLQSLYASKFAKSTRALLTPSTR